MISKARANSVLGGHDCVAFAMIATMRLKGEGARFFFFSLSGCVLVSTCSKESTQDLTIDLQMDFSATFTVCNTIGSVDFVFLLDMQAVSFTTMRQYMPWYFGINFDFATQARNRDVDSSWRVSYIGEVR